MTDKAEALTFFGEPFAGVCGCADTVPISNVFAAIDPPCAPGAPWICRVFCLGHGIVWVDDPSPGPHLIRRAEAAYLDHVRDLADVAGLDVDE